MRASTLTRLDAMSMSKDTLADIGLARANQFLDLNGIKAPAFGINHTAKNNGFKSGYGCGWYRPYMPNQRASGPYVSVTVQACANPAVGVARSWSFPTYKTDRTPAGVVAHEVGHHIDHMLNIVRHGSADLRLTAKQPITSYEPNVMELVAETLRLFILNPDLLSIVSPDRYWYMRQVVGLIPSEEGTCLEVLKSLSAPDTYINAVKKRLAAH